LPEVAQLLGISPRTADRLWAYARAWLHQEIQGTAQIGDLSENPWRDSGPDCALKKRGSDNG
jgi:hypothetical protein